MAVAYRPLGSIPSASEEGLWCCAFGRPSGKEILLTGGLDGKVQLWDVPEAAENVVSTSTLFESHKLAVISIATSSNGALGASSSMDGTISLYNLESRSLIKTIQSPAPSDIWSVNFNSEGSVICSGGQSGAVHLFSTESGECLRTLGPSSSPSFTLYNVFSPDGRHLASSHMDGSICIYEVESGTQIHRITTHAMPVRSLSFSPDSKLIASASDDRTVRLHCPPTGELSCTLQGHSAFVMSVAFSPLTKNGGILASCSADGRVRLWEVATRQSLASFDRHSDSAMCVAFNHNGSRLASVSEDKSISLYDCPLDASK